MTSSYVSARFEKTDLTPSLGAVRCIVRALDDGPVPPPPGPAYFPTSPDALRNFLVLEYVNDTLGERYSRIATLADTAGLTARPLNAFECSAATFVTNGVVPGDYLELILPEPLEWQSEEYPAAPYRFLISNVLSETQLTVVQPIPSFKANVSWTIAGKASGAVNGTTRRSGFPSAGAVFIDARANLLFPDVPTLDAFEAAAKAGLDALASSSTSTTLTSENYSAGV